MIFCTGKHPWVVACIAETERMGWNVEFIDSRNHDLLDSFFGPHNCHGGFFSAYLCFCSVNIIYTFTI